MKKVIFVTGFKGSRSDCFLLKLLLKKDFEVLYFDYDTSFNERIETIANQLKKFIEKIKLKKSEKLSIVGFSMGGLVAEYYLKFSDKKNIDKFITICSPFKGTPWASIFFKKRKGIKEIKEDSLFLKKLNKKKLKGIKQKSIYSEEDFIVPGESGKRGRKTKKSFFFFHPLAPSWPPIISEVKKFLKS